LSGTARKYGVISDTHGLLRPEAVDALRGCELIIHAGDVGKDGILAQLEAIAPTKAVRGNVDHGGWANALPETEVVTLDGGMLVYVLHDLDRLDLDPAAAGFAMVVSGHSHRPLVEERGGVVYLNPGSAGPRRFTLPVTLAHVTIDNGKPRVELVELVKTP
jgi:putative phosphoesterase